MILLDGKKLADKISLGLKKKSVELKKMGTTPTLHIYMVGDNPASKVYVEVKKKKAAEIGAKCQVKKFSANCKLETVVQAINKSNQDPKCHGIIVQLPLPDQLDPNQLLQVIDTNKDVDGLTYLNQWKLIYGIKTGFCPATAKGILTLLDEHNIELEGRKVVVVGRSRLVGRPTSLLMLNHDATVTVCHSRTKYLKKETSLADILIIATGQPRMFGPEYIKPGAIVIDVGITRTGDKTVGDVDFEMVKNKVAAISPVPGGVGPMTVVSLFENLMEAVEKKL